MLSYFISKEAAKSKSSLNTIHIIFHEDITTERIKGMARHAKDLRRIGGGCIE